MSCKVLYGLGIHSGGDQVGDICMPEKMGRNVKIDGIHDSFSGGAFLSDYGLKLPLYGCAVYILIHRAFSGTSDHNIMPQSDKLMSSQERPFLVRDNIVRL